MLLSSSWRKKVSLSLDEIPSGTECFIDSNIFIYHFTGVSDECTRFLKRCENRYISGVTATNVILEVLHCLMMIEAVKKGLIAGPNILKKLQKSYDKVRDLIDYSSNVEKIHQMGIKILSFTWETIKSSQVVRAHYGLLVNDSLIITIMKEAGINVLASNDEAFKRVDIITLCQPSDLKGKFEQTG